MENFRLDGLACSAFGVLEALNSDVSIHDFIDYAEFLPASENVSTSFPRAAMLPSPKMMKSLCQRSLTVNGASMSAQRSGQWRL